jgi:PAS domain S-box-containing protein
MERQVLHNWKHIADYLNTSVRTVQRWEAELAFPVRRVRESKRCGVFAFRDDVEHWVASRARTRELSLVSSEQLRAVFLDSQFPMAIFDDDRRILEINAVAARVLGHERNHLIGHRLDEFFLGKRESLRRQWKNYLRRGTFDGREHIRSSSGEAYSIHVSRHAIRPGLHFSIILSSRTEPAGKSYAIAPGLDTAI